MTSDQCFTICDRYGNEIYLTQERWKHIIDIVTAYTPSVIETIPISHLQPLPITAL